MSASAGGFSSSFLPLSNCSLVSGFNFFRKSIELEKLIKAAKIVVTGEGIFDQTSLHGKFPMEILRLSKKYKKKINFDFMAILVFPFDNLV